MATISNTTLPSVENDQQFSAVRTIEHELYLGSPALPDEVLTLDSPPLITIARTDGADNPVLGITVTAELSGDDISVAFNGAHELALFDSEVHHFTKGKSNLWETPIVSKSFADVIGKNRQVFKWVPDQSSQSVSITVAYNSSFHGDVVATFTQVVSPNYTNSLDDFLQNISA